MHSETALGRRSSRITAGSQRGDSATLSEDEIMGLMDGIAQDKDVTAFTRLFEHFAPRLKAYVMRHGTDAAAAEEVAQETMLTVWRRAAIYDRRKAGPSAWIFAIVRNKRIDMIRRERRPELNPDDPILAGDPPVQPDEDVEFSQRSEVLRRQLNGLPAEQSEILQKAYLEDKPHSAISQELGLPLGTVKSRIRLALSRLRTSISETDV